MTTRTRRETVVFSQPVRLRGIDRELPAGSYDVVTDEELIEGLSFPVFRRVATMITVPCAPPRHSAGRKCSRSTPKPCEKHKTGNSLAVPRSITQPASYIERIGNELHQRQVSRL